MEEDAKSNKPWLAGKPKDKESVYNGLELWEVACEYFEWCDRTPITEFRHSRTDTHAVDLPRAYSIEGFLLYAGLSRRQWEKYCTEGALTAFCAGNIHHAIRCQKLEYAAVKVMDPTLVAKELGLANRSVTTTTREGIFEALVETPKMGERQAGEEVIEQNADS